MIQTSIWPTILNSDYALSRGVRKRFVALSWLATVGVVLLVMVGVSTPLGLSEKLELGKPEDTPFQYSHDPGPFGSGTAERDTYQYSRVCGGEAYMNCPGVDGGYQTWTEGFDTYSTFNETTDIIDLRIPPNITEVFTSFTDGTTISSLFDIQYRAYFSDSTAGVDTMEPLQNNEPYTRGELRTLQSLVLNNKVELVEGLIVDTVHGGLGFRNHTLPAQAEFGSEWDEDVLWVEPVTECVDTNLTIEFEYLKESYGPVEPKVFLIDNGGMVNLTTEYPPVDKSDPQGDPQLRAIAYRAAVMNNLLTAAYYNLTQGRQDYGKAALGAHYDLRGGSDTTETTPYTPEVNQILTTGFTGDFLPLPWSTDEIYSQAEAGLITQLNFTVVGMSPDIFPLVPFQNLPRSQILRTEFSSTSIPARSKNIFGELTKYQTRKREGIRLMRT